MSTSIDSYTQLGQVEPEPQEPGDVEPEPTPEPEPAEAKKWELIASVFFIILSRPRRLYSEDG